MKEYRLSMKEKKELFQKICKQMKAKGLDGEYFLDAVYKELERLYDEWDVWNGLSWNEQHDFDDHCNQWLKELGMQERI